MPFMNRFKNRSQIAAGWWIMVISTFTVFSVGVIIAGLPAVRFNDQTNDPWVTFAFFRFDLVGLFLLPIITGMLMWIYYNSNIWSFLHLFTCVCVVSWGCVCIVYGIFDVWRCNDRTGSTPDVPWCTNSNYPAASSPDRFWWFVFIGTCAATLSTVGWLAVGLRILNIINLAEAFKINAHIGTPFADPDYVKHIGTMMYSWYDPEAKESHD